MKRNHRRFLLPFCGCLLAVAAVRGQVARLMSTPPLGDALPLAETSDGVRLKFPVLLNGHSVVGTNALLRSVYIDPNAGLHLHSPDAGGAGQGFQGSQHHHSGGFQKPMANDGFGDDATPGESSDQAGTTDKKALAQEIGAEVWKQPQLFRDALNAAADLGTMVVYSVPGRQKPISAEVDFPDGMLLGAIQNQVTVLALTNGSEALQAGMQPQDEIRSVDGQALAGSLEQFIQIYHDVTQRARKAGQSYSFEVWRPTESKLIMIQVGAPPSIPSMF